MADDWWSSARTDDGGGGWGRLFPHAGRGASACSTVLAADQDDAAASAPPSFLADPPHMVDWAQAYMGGRAAAEGTGGGSFNALLQLHGDAGRHFLLDQQQQPDDVDGAAPQGATLYADSQYSGYGDLPAAPVAKPLAFSQQHLSGFFGSSTRSFSGVPSVPPMTTKPLLLQALENKAFKPQKEPGQEACSSATSRRSVPDSPPAASAKKPRIATPSPLPTFKVRKEKLGDRITALQQLVSPFGKTDTASVLHEAIEYIRFLHDQVASLSSPYLRCGRPVQVQQLQQQPEAKDRVEVKEDLRSRGLCLVPVASTYAVASETAPEFWHPTFGGTFQ